MLACGEQAPTPPRQAACDLVRAGGRRHPDCDAAQAADNLRQARDGTPSGRCRPAALDSPLHACRPYNGGRWRSARFASAPAAALPERTGARDGIFHSPRRAEVPAVDRPEPPAERRDLLLRAAPRWLPHPGAPPCRPLCLTRRVLARGRPDRPHRSGVLARDRSAQLDGRVKMQIRSSYFFSQLICWAGSGSATPTASPSTSRSSAVDRGPGPSYLLPFGLPDIAQPAAPGPGPRVSSHSRLPSTTTRSLQAVERAADAERARHRHTIAAGRSRHRLREPAEPLSGRRHLPACTDSILLNPSGSPIAWNGGHHRLTRTIEVPRPDAAAAPPSGAPRLRLCRRGPSNGRRHATGSTSPSETTDPPQSGHFDGHGSRTSTTKRVRQPEHRPGRVSRRSGCVAGR